MELTDTDIPNTANLNNQGWQKVTNLKKQRRQDAKTVKSKENSVVSDELNAKSADLDQSVFSVLNMEAKERRSRMASKASQANGNGDLHENDDSDSDSDTHDGKANGINPEESKKKAKKVKKPKVSVADAALKIDFTNLSLFLSEISESFPGAHDVQLMRCADYFAQAFKNVSSEKFSWPKLTQDLSLVKLCEIPLCFISEQIYAVTIDWISSHPAEELGKFVFLLIKSILECVNPSSKRTPASTASSKAKVGSFVVLAMVLRKRPDVLIQEAEILRTSPDFQGKNKLPTIAWVYGQAASSDLVAGMWLWTRNLLPLTVGNQSTAFAREISLDFIQGIIFEDVKKARKVLLVNGSKKGERLIPPLAFHSILCAAFPPDSARSKFTQRLQSIYPFIKEIALVSSPNNKTSKPSALQLVSLTITAASEEADSLAEEACSIFAWCISQNDNCYKIWEKHHLEHLNGSTKILTYLVREWPAYSQHLLPYDKLKQTLKNLRKQNADAKDKFAEDYVNLKLLKKCESACKTLLSKLSSFSNCLKVSATLVAGAAMAYGFYLLGPEVNPWNWDGLILLSKTHPII